MPAKDQETAAKARTASNPGQNKSGAPAAKRLAPTAASSRPRRAAKPANESKGAPEPIPRPPKRKRPSTTETENKAKGNENAKKPTPKLKVGVVTATLTAANGEIPSPHDASGGALDGKNFWLMKAEPLSRMEKGKDVKFSIDDLEAAKEPEGWDGVRNMAARNNMRAMKKGDFAFFYHSNCPTPGIAGIMAIVKEHSIDHSAHDPDHPYYDPKSTEDKPKWSLVHVEFRRKFDQLVTLKELQQHSKTPGSPLENLQTLKQSRLSVSKVSREEWTFINRLATSKEENPELD